MMKIVVLDVEQNSQGVIDGTVRFAATPTNLYTESVPWK
jgi:hypothetical protein